MVNYFNPGGYKLGSANLDGYGITLVALTVMYTVSFFAAVAYLWSKRNHPVVRSRKIGLALLAIVILHVYLCMILTAFPLHDKVPCGLEYWIMSTCLPIGIGLFSAANQRLLLVSRQQKQLTRVEESYKPIYPYDHNGLICPRHWSSKLRAWWQLSTSQNNYEGFIVVGMIVQFVVSLTIYLSSRKFSRHGFLSHHTTRTLCRRGWEWAPSIASQALWNYLPGPYLLWQMRRIPHDIYKWRIQTILAITAGIPGTPMWLAGVYSDRLNVINKWVVPATWLVPGLVMIEVVTLIFPIIAIRKHDKASRGLEQSLADYEAQRRIALSSFRLTPSTNVTESDRIYTMQSLDERLNFAYEGLQAYAALIEHDCLNTVLLIEVLRFKDLGDMSLSTDVFRSCESYQRARKRMFCKALSIFVNLIYLDTASYPINIESRTYDDLVRMFCTATELIPKVSRRKSGLLTRGAVGTPWKESLQGVSPQVRASAFPMRAMPYRSPKNLNNSCKYITSPTERTEFNEPLADYETPLTFNQYIFDAAYKTIRFTVWSGIYQRFMAVNARTIHSAARA